MAYHKDGKAWNEHALEHSTRPEWVQALTHQRKHLYIRDECCYNQDRAARNSFALNIPPFFPFYSSPFPSIPSFLFPPFFLLFLPFFRSPGVGLLSQIELEDSGPKARCKGLGQWRRQLWGTGNTLPRLPTISFLVHFRVNLTVNYPNIV